MLKAMKIKCGSGLAREGVSPANIDVEWPTAIAGKPAPTGDLRLTDEHWGRPARHMGEFAAFEGWVDTLHATSHPRQKNPPALK